ncbi:MAG: YicC/YloC family endoribonuclease [Pseudomonadota bacterium]
MATNDATPVTELYAGGGQVHSMTAFARRQVSVKGRLLVWELRSVNHRFLEPQLRLPDAMRQLEAPLRDLLRKHVARGKIDCTLRIEVQEVGAGITLNRNLLLNLLSVLEQVRRDAPDIGAPNPIELLRWPGIIGDQSEVEQEFLGSSVTDLFEEALGELLSYRKREGSALFETVSERLNEIERLVGECVELTRDLSGLTLRKLKQRLADLGANTEGGRIEQEVALLASRADVAEELDRLQIHVEEARSSLRGPGPHGRRLDFLTQELNREANTLASKSILAETSQRAVELKVMIEQIREQVQNIE